jgi:hypothetical protein
MAKDNAFGFEQPSKTGSEQDDLRSTLAWITLDFTILFFPLVLYRSSWF